MNELMVDFGNENWLYYKTHEDTIDEAYNNFLHLLEEFGINYDNMNPKEIALRDENLDDIEVKEC